MQITILRVAAKPQQFLKWLKKGFFCFQIRIIFQPHPLSREDGAGGIPTLVLVACWCSVLLFKTRGEIPKFFWGEAETVVAARRRGRLVGPRRAGFSGLEATEGGLLPRRCLMTGSGFICLSFSQRGWWADQLVSLDGGTCFALRPLSTQGTLWVSVPGKREDGGRQNPPGQTTPPPHVGRTQAWVRAAHSGWPIRSDLRQVPRTRAAQLDFDVSLIHGSARSRPRQLCVRTWNTSRFLEYHNEHGAPRPRPKTTTASLATGQPSPSALLHTQLATLLNCPRSPPKGGKVIGGPWSSRPQACIPCNSSGICCKGGKPRDSLFSTWTITVDTWAYLQRFSTEATGSWKKCPSLWVLSDKGELFTSLDTQTK